MDSQPIIPAAKTHQDGLTARERYEAYRYAAAPLCQADPLRKREAEDAQCCGWLVDDVLMGRSSFTWTRFKRSTRLARQGGAFLLESCKGFQHGHVDNHPFRMCDDTIVLRDLSHPFETLGYAEDIMGFFIPRYRIQNSDWLERQAPVVTFSASSPNGRILRNTMQSVLDLLPNLPQSAAEGVTAGVIGLLNGLLTTEEKQFDNNPQTDEACLDTMKKYLQERLADPKLSASTLTESFHCSRATVYRLFADEGGVAAYIRQQRLSRCYKDLSRTGKRQGAVQKIAERRGFQDPYHFSRLFKRTFGVAPSEIIGSGLLHHGATIQGTESTGAPFHSWLLDTMETNGQGAIA